MVDHFAHPFDGLLHLTLQEIIRTQLIAQILLGFQHLRRRLFNGIQHGDSGCVVLTLHERIAQQLIDLALVFGVRELVQEVVESPHGLTQRAGRLVGAERVIIRRLFLHSGCQTIGCCGLERQLRLFGHRHLHVRVTHRQAGSLRDRVFLLLHLLEVLHRVFVFA